MCKRFSRNHLPNKLVNVVALAYAYIQSRSTQDPRRGTALISSQGLIGEQGNISILSLKETGGKLRVELQ